MGRRVVRVVRSSGSARGRSSHQQALLRAESDTGPPVVSHEDPESSHVAAGLVEPKRGTRRANVLDVLWEAQGKWVDGSVLVQPDIGGMEGTRRLRELRQLGWEIDQRPKPGSTMWQYRLLNFRQRQAT